MPNSNNKFLFCAGVIPERYTDPKIDWIPSSISSYSAMLRAISLWKDACEARGSESFENRNVHSGVFSSDGIRMASEARKALVREHEGILSRSGTNQSRTDTVGWRDLLTDKLVHNYGGFTDLDAALFLVGDLKWLIDEVLDSSEVKDQVCQSVQQCLSHCNKESASL
jgi:hypothetical protein